MSTRESLKWLLALAIAGGMFAVGIWVTLLPYDLLTLLFNIPPNLILQRGFGLYLIITNGALFCFAWREFIKERRAGLHPPQ